MLCRVLSEESLELYLLQLVQALRYEEQLYVKEDKQITVKRTIRMVQQKSDYDSPIDVPDLVQGEQQSVHLSTIAESHEESHEEAPNPTEENSVMNTLASEGVGIDGTSLSNSVFEEPPREEPPREADEGVIEETVEELQTVTVISPVSPLLEFLVRRCAMKRSLASLFLRYLRVEASPQNESDDNASLSYESGFTHRICRCDTVFPRSFATTSGSLCI